MSANSSIIMFILWKKKQNSPKTTSCRNKKEGSSIQFNQSPIGKENQRSSAKWSANRDPAEGTFSGAKWSKTWESPSTGSPKFGFYPPTKSEFWSAFANHSNPSNHAITFQNSSSPRSILRQPITIQSFQQFRIKFQAHRFLHFNFEQVKSHE